MVFQTGSPTDLRVQKPHHELGHQGTQVGKALALKPDILGVQILALKLSWGVILGLFPLLL